MPADIVIIQQPAERVVVQGQGAPAKGVVVVRPEPQILVIRAPGQPALGIAVVRPEPQRIVVHAPGVGSSVRVVAAPLSESTPAIHPSMAISAPYVYFTIADNTWRRAALSKFS